MNNEMNNMNNMNNDMNNMNQMNGNMNNMNNMNQMNGNMNNMNNMNQMNGNMNNMNNMNQMNGNMNNKQTNGNNKIVKIVLIALGVLVGIIIIGKLLGGSSSGGGTAASGKGMTISNKLYNMTISIEDTQKSVEYKSDGTLLSSFDLDGTFTKIKVNIKNNDSKEASISSYVVPFYLMDSSKNKITSCSYGSAIQDQKLENEKLQETIPAKSSISGYVYCKTDSTDGAILNINVPSSASTNSSGGYSIQMDEYYFNLN